MKFDGVDRMFIGLVIFAIIVASLAWSQAYPHDAARPELNKWFESLHSGKGPCCADADGALVADADWASVTDTTKPNVHYKVRIDRQWVDVPDDAVLKEPNKDGRTIVWGYPMKGWGNGTGYYIRCFIVGWQG
jgi:hypothetical protein